MFESNITIISKNTPISSESEIVISNITSSWNKVAEYMMEVAITLHELKTNKSNKKLWVEVRDSLIERKIMSRTIISNLCKVGENQLLVQNVNLLPRSYNTMWELTKLTEDDLEDKFNQGLINPELKLEQVRQWSINDVIESDFEIIEEVSEDNPMKRSVTIYINEEDIINNPDIIEEHIKQIESIMDYAQIETSGLLKRKIEGD
jgi:hypothetical protein